MASASVDDVLRLAERPFVSAPAARSRSPVTPMRAFIAARASAPRLRARLVQIWRPRAPRPATSSSFEPAFTVAKTSSIVRRRPGLPGRALDLVWKTSTPRRSIMSFRSLETFRSAHRARGARRQSGRDRRCGSEITGIACSVSEVKQSPTRVRQRGAGHGSTTSDRNDLRDVEAVLGLDALARDAGPDHFGEADSRRARPYRTRSSSSSRIALVHGSAPNGRSSATSGAGRAWRDASTRA